MAKYKQQKSMSAQQNSTKSYSKEEVEARIRQKAQELCNKRGCTSGNDLADWFEAERIVKQELRIA